MDSGADGPVVMTASVESGQGAVKYLTLTPLKIKTVETSKLVYRSEIYLPENTSVDQYVDEDGTKLKTEYDSDPDIKMENSDDKQSLKVCRTCLRIDGRQYNLVKDRNGVLLTAYQDVTGVIVDNDIPVMICWECAQRLMNGYSFRDQCLRSYELLLQVRAVRSSITLHDITSINRKSVNLCSSLSTSHLGTNKFTMEIIANEEIRENRKRNVQTELSNKKRKLVEEKENKEKEEQIHTEVDIDIIKEEDNSKADSDFEWQDSCDREDVKIEENRKVGHVSEKEIEKKNEEIEKENVAKEVKVTSGKNKSRIKVKKKNSQVITQPLDQTLFTILKITAEEQIEERERRRESEKYKNSPFKCEECYTGFNTEHKLTMHSQKHTPAYGQFVCSICKVRKKKKINLTRHILSAHKRKYICNKCDDFTTRYRGIAKSHQKYHEGFKYECERCFKVFNRMSSYFSHMRLVHYCGGVCQLCGFTFLSERGVVQHQKAVHNVESIDGMELKGPYCKECDVTFMSARAHARHLLLSSKHTYDGNPDRVSIYNDSSCGVWLEDANSAGDDVTKQRKGEIKVPITCEICKTECPSMRSIAQHMRRAHPGHRRVRAPGRGQLMCELCGAVLASTFLLREHKERHKNEVYQCDICSKTCKTKYCLKKHVHTHFTSPPRQGNGCSECPVCGRSVTTNNMGRHMKIHGDRSYVPCDICGKSFTTKEGMKNHKNHVHLDKPWPSRPCRKKKT